MIGAIPETWQEALAAWDAGEPVFTIELGGLGPSYEQTMHIAIFESLRHLADVGTMAPEEQKKAIEAAVTNADREKKLQMSGAQFFQIVGYLYRVINHGWSKTVIAVDRDRRIQVMNWWPGKS